MPKNSDDFLDTGTEAHGSGFDLHLAGFDLGEIQYAVHQTQQGFSAGLNHFQPLAVFILNVRIK